MFFSSRYFFLDFRKKNPIITNVAAEEPHSGTSILKAFKIMNVPKNRIEYIAPFFRNTYFLILSMLPTVICLTIIAPSPLPIKISGTESVNANAPKTPSIEKVASIISKYKILLMSERFLFFSSFSFASAFCLNP